ncbi:divalent-cation tolerance protein CutA [Streptomyces sp. NPDC088729]|uniref:divalent-cation tolerance protein CutA n=1 Tax=Streptomyces sp. NPDC088729 TaxID=3365876 RepID=UPI0038238975
MTAPPEWLTVLTTIDSEDKAHALAQGAVEARLAACAQISAPVTSVHRWQDAIETSEEWQVQLKTTSVRYEELEKYIEREHDYETPEIIAIPVVRGSTRYLGWVTAETAPETAL